jgi:hypothetical protein
MYVLDGNALVASTEETPLTTTAEPTLSSKKPSTGTTASEDVAWAVSKGLPYVCKCASCNPRYAETIDTPTSGKTKLSGTWRNIPVPSRVKINLMSQRAKNASKRPTPASATSDPNPKQTASNMTASVQNAFREIQEKILLRNEMEWAKLQFRRGGESE